MYYHASQTPGIQVLKPGCSNHKTPLVYLSTKKENTLVYLSNAVKKYCEETGFSHEGPWCTWASYGFSKDGILVLEEYYPDATRDTYSGVSGYIYRIEKAPGAKAQQDIPFAAVTAEPVPVNGCTFVPDAYEALQRAAHEGLIILKKYEENSPKMLAWIESAIKSEYAEAAERPDYRYFLKNHFSFLW